MAYSPWPLAPLHESWCKVLHACVHMCVRGCCVCMSACMLVYMRLPGRPATRLSVCPSVQPLLAYSPWPAAHSTQPTANSL